MIQSARLATFDPQPPANPQPSRTDYLSQFVVMCGNDNFSQWFYQEIVSGRPPL